MRSLSEVTVTNQCGRAVLDLATGAIYVRDMLTKLAIVVSGHREQWLCESEGQWPDRFTLLNRYVRTDFEPPFIFNE